MYNIFYNNFNFLTPKQKKMFRESDIFIHLLLFLSSMFEYKGFSDTVNTDFIEYYNILSPLGGCGIFDDGRGNKIVGYLTQGGFKDPYGVCETFNVNTLNGTNKQGLVDGINGAVIWNNKTHSNDLVLLSRYTEMLNLCETAQKCLLRYARLFPVFEVADENILNKIKEALKNADNGEPFTYATKSLTKLGFDGTAGVTPVQLGDISAVEKIQYLSTYHNDLLKCFFSMFGMAYSMSTKQAQQSIEEVHSENKISWILPNDRLNERKKGVDTYNKVFKENASVDFSKAWLDAYYEFMGKEGVEDVGV